MNLKTKNKKYFTLDQANKSLILIKPILVDVFECLNQIAQIKEQYNTLSHNFTENQNAELQKFQHKLIYHLNELKYIGVNRRSS
jgi:hypothetical protein